METAQRPKWRRLDGYLVTGLLVWVPLTVTLFVVRFLVDFVDRSLVLVPHAYRPEELVGFRIPGLGILLVLTILLLTGIVFRNLLGQRLVGLWERQLGKIPFLGSIYRGSKQVTETLLKPGGKSFRQVVLVRWPHRDVRTFAFVTGDVPGEVAQKTGEELVLVFVPTTPNPTSGFLTAVPRRDVVPLDMTVEAALRMVVSLGVVPPEWPDEAPGRAGLADAP
jgi:uncharacterized membrane protein